MIRLPERLRKSVARRVIKQGFRNYKPLAQWVRRQGHDISVDSLRRFGVRLATELKTPASFPGGDRRARVRAKSGARAARTEGLVQLTQEKLCAALSEINQLKQGDMSRLAHAVAH